MAKQEVKARFLKHTETGKVYAHTKTLAERHGSMVECDKDGVVLKDQPKVEQPKAMERLAQPAKK